MAQRIVVWTAQAAADLDEVAAYVAQQSESDARRIVQEAIQRAEDRVRFAESGAIVPETDTPEIREVLVRRSFRLIYTYSEAEVHILAFVRARRRVIASDLRERRPLS